MKKIVALLLALVLVTGMVSTAAAGWENSGGGWWYSKDGGGYYQNEWLQDGAWYYFDGSGWMVTGWRQIGGAWYYFEGSGAMATGWKNIGGTWYYFDAGGAMATGWRNLGSWYYFDAGGAMVTGWLDLGGTWYYFDEGGAMATGTRVIDGKEYTFDAGGAWIENAAPAQTGWVQNGGIWTYYDENGVMATGWAQIGGAWYFFEDSGAMATGWKAVGGTWYYFDASGAMQTGWLQQGGVSYYFDASGAMAVGWKAVNGTYYYFDASGAMKTGWLQEAGNWYYLKENGMMVTGDLAIDGVLYTFDENGAMTDSKPMSQIDFGGKTIYIYDYWGNFNIPEARLAQVEKEYNCKIVREQRGDWGTIGDEMKTYVANGGEENAYALFIVEPGKVSDLITSGVAASWNYDFSTTDWNKAETEFLTIGGKTYGAVPDNGEPRQMLFFNKRVLAEAGIDYETIYDAQKNGTWTWDMLTELLQKTTRDTDNDGVNDVYGITGSKDDLYQVAVFAGGGSFVDYDENDQLQPTLGEDKARTALEWATNLWADYAMPRPEDSSWDWYKQAFMAGNTAFYSGQGYSGFNGGYYELSEMGDEWGAVAFPTVDKNGNYMTVISDNVTVMPNLYDKETNAALATVYDTWTKGYDDPEADGAWRSELYTHTDTRAVDETYDMLAQEEHQVVNKSNLLGSVNDVLGANLFWWLGGEEQTFSETIESAVNSIKTLCDEFNAKMATLK